MDLSNYLVRVRLTFFYMDRSWRVVLFLFCFKLMQNLIRCCNLGLNLVFNCYHGCLDLSYS